MRFCTPDTRYNCDVSEFIFDSWNGPRISLSDLWSTSARSTSAEPRFLQRPFVPQSLRQIHALQSFCCCSCFHTQEEKKKFEKQTAKFIQSQERHLNLSTKKQDAVLQEVNMWMSIVSFRKPVKAWVY